MAIALCILAAASPALTRGHKLRPSDRTLRMQLDRDREVFAQVARAGTSASSKVAGGAGHEVGVRAVKQDPRWPGVVFLVIWKGFTDDNPCETEVSEKGVAYAAGARLPTTESLDQRSQELGFRFVSVGEGWYLYDSCLVDKRCE